MIRFYLLAICLLITGTNHIYSQETTRSPGSFDFNESGIIFQTYDTSSSVTMRFRIQSFFNYNTISDDDLSAASNELAVRRMRLRFGGIIHRNISFNLQLGFSRRDWDADDSDVPNIIRDAMIFWNIAPNAQLGFGQTKLPGNRQRVISSGDQQFSDRSIVNAKFTLDRDFGFQGLYSTNILDIPINLRGSVSSGDGRYAPQMQGFNLAYTGRIEILPFGKFTKGGDYFEGDLLFEKTPKLSIGVSYSHNEKATRDKGQLGPALLSPRDQSMILSDAIFKYKGIALYGEFAKRDCDDPFTGMLNGTPVYVYKGYGYLIQASYLIFDDFEIAERVATVVPDKEIETFKGGEWNRHITTCLTYYVNKHRIKAQLEVTHNSLENMATNVIKNNWIGRFNMEFGI